MPDSRIVQDRPPVSTNPGSAIDAIETFDANVGSGRRLDEVGKAVGDTSCSSPINQDVKGVGVKQGAMCHGGARVGTVSLSSSNAHSDCRENNSHGMVAGSGPLAPRKGSRSRMEGSSTRAATTKISGLDMDVGSMKIARSSKAVLMSLSQDCSHREQVESLRLGT
jgi:hypothetical protein